MVKIFIKNNDTTEASVEVTREQIEALLHSERWQPNRGDKEVVQEGAKGAFEQLSATPDVGSKSIDLEKLTKITSSDIIDRFLRQEPHRIVAEEGEVREEIITVAELDDEDDMVSEELAEVYLSQGLTDMAKETYRKLSLLNPEKSVYFAGLISEIDKNN